MVARRIRGRIDVLAERLADADSPGFPDSPDSPDAPHIHDSPDVLATPAPPPAQATPERSAAPGDPRSPDHPYAPARPVWIGARTDAGTFRETTEWVPPPPVDGSVDGTGTTGTTGTGPGSGDIDPRLRDRLMTVAWCLALSVLAFASRPGRILADTKIDMAVNPFGFLGRALHLWDTEQLGQLQNQAVGYLFPMGPFHAIGDLIGMPPWITQRLWLATLLCAAFVGTRRLAGRLGIGGPVTATVAGLVYALAPNGLATLGQISSEYLPFAMLPWIVLPLVTAAEGGNRRRAAARSGIAVAFCGGINAAATVAVLVVPALYLLTRPRGTPRIRILAWWSAAVGFATTWWLFPLMLTGTYGFSWLTYTEKAATTTGPTGLVNVLRGTQRWVNYLIVDGQIWWPVGRAFSLDTLPVLCTGVVAALGIAGLLRSRLPERVFILLTLLAGITIITAGHLSTIEGPAAAPVRELLDGVLAPLRNVHKFDALVRLPIAFGVAHLVVSIPRAAPRLRLRAMTAASLALAGLAGTALITGLSGPGDFTQVPKSWRDAAAWLNGRAGEQAVLAIPGSPFGEYLWGRPMDDIMQPLLTARWGVRQLVPAGSPGYTRALDAIDRQVAAGRSGAGLSEFLGRMGIRYVLVRNDLEREGLRGAWPARLHEALDGSPGMRKVAEFGEPVGTGGFDDATGAFDQSLPALEVYEVADADDAVSLADADRPIRLYGSPEALLTMADNGALRGRQVLLNDDAPDLGGTPVTSDSLRLVRRNFGELHETGPTLPEKDRRVATDILEAGWSRYATTAFYSGIAKVTASSSAADFDAIPQNHDLGRLPFAALDGNPFTYWETGGWSGPVGEWLRVDFEQPRTPRQVTATFVQNTSRLGPQPRRIAVETEAGVLAQQVGAVTSAQPLRVPQGPTRWLRIRILELTSRPLVAAFARAGLSELTIDGVRAGRHYRLPETAASAARGALPQQQRDPGSKPTDQAPAQTQGGAGMFVMARSPGLAGECMKGSVRWVCAPELERQDEEGGGFDREFTAAAAARSQVVGAATLVDPGLIERYSKPASTVEPSASSSRSKHPAAQARSAFDGDEATTWIAGVADTTPVYTLAWQRPIALNQVTIKRPPAARGPLRVRVTGDDGETREGLVDEQGRLPFAPIRTRSLRLTFTTSQVQGLQITELVVPGLRPLSTAAQAPLNLRCGLGPNLRINGVPVPTKATGTMGDLLAGRPLRFQACRRAALVPGTNRLVAAPFDPYRLESVVLDAAGGLDARSDSGAVVVRSWSQDTRELEIQADKPSFLVVNENYNGGWQAKAGDTVLRPVRLDGWKQAWLIPEGTEGQVRLTYRPDRAQRLTVVVGLNLLLLLAVIAFWPGAGPQRRSEAAQPGTLSKKSKSGKSGKKGKKGEKASARVRPLVFVMALAIAAGVGFWIAGVVGLAVTTGVAAVSGLARTGNRRLVRAVASPWPAALATLLAALSWLAGGALRTSGNPAAPTDLLGDVVPQLLGLVVVGRVAIALWPYEKGGGSPELSAAPAPEPAGPAGPFGSSGR